MPGWVRSQAREAALGSLGGAGGRNPLTSELGLSCSLHLEKVPALVYLFFGAQGLLEGIIPTPAMPQALVTAWGATATSTGTADVGRLCPTLCTALLLSGHESWNF